MSVLGGEGGGCEWGGVNRGVLTQSLSNILYYVAVEIYCLNVKTIGFFASDYLVLSPFIDLLIKSRNRVDLRNDIKFLEFFVSLSRV